MQRLAFLALSSMFAAALAGCSSGGSGDEEVLPTGTFTPPTGLPPLSEVHAWWAVDTIESTIVHDPVAKQSSSTTTYAIANRYPGDLPYFELSTDGMRVTSVTVDGEAAEVQVQENSALINIVFAAKVYNATLPGDVSPGARHTVVVEAAGWEEDYMLGGGSVGTDLPLSDLQAFPQLGVVPIPTTYTVPTMTVHLSRPASWTYVLSAFPTGPAEESGGIVNQTYQVQSQYLLLFAGKDLPSLRDVVGGVEVITHYHPDMQVQGRTLHEMTKRALQEMQAIMGPFPYPSITTVPAKVAVNAFSTPGVTTMGLNFYRAIVPFVPQQFGRFAPWVGGGEQYELVVVHEFTHNWWGHQVANNNSFPARGINDHYITEGFTTYLSEVAYYDRVYGREDAAASMESKWRDQQQARLTGTDSPVTEQGDYYEKTALALRVLDAHYRYVGKEAAFLETFRGLYRHAALNHGGSGVLRHEEVVAAFSASYGEDLAPFFATWLQGIELPDIAVESPDASGATIANRGAVAVPVEVRFRDAQANQNVTVLFLEPGDAVR
ncbi:MAG TPA: hypothetical protein VI796_03505, partial [Candidatus Thermoplasmatota archaeon]|nr:hypothetical protein [Candidatus Thermoplasmatota archaeon]